MNKRQFLVVWALAAWLIFSFLNAAYHPTRTIKIANNPVPQDNPLAELENYRFYPAYWEFRGEEDKFLILAFPGILIAIPLVLTLRNKKKVENQEPTN